MNINNKIKQFFGGNWGSDKWTKRHTEIPKDFGYEKIRASQKKKKKKEPWMSERDMCPFCKKQLEIDSVATEKRRQDSPWGIGIFSTVRKTECKCGAMRVEDCPCCHRKTWYKTGIYKHQRWGCGFVGEKIRVSSRRKKNGKTNCGCNKHNKNNNLS